MALITCPNCHKEFEIGTAAFCPFCGSKLNPDAPVAPQPQAAPQPKTPAEVETALRDIGKDMTPKKIQQLLDKLLAKYPDDLRLNEEKLFATRVMDPKARMLDFSVIKCHLLMYYLKPDDFKPEQKAAMRNDIFHHEQLEKCLSLAPDADAFLLSYTRRLCSEFVNIFLHSSTQYNRSILGFRFEKRMDRNLAAPVARMMMNIYSDGGLTVPQRDLLYEGMFYGLRNEVTNTSYLEEYLLAENLPVPKLA